MTWFAAPFKDRTTLDVHVILSLSKRPKRRGYTLCAKRVEPMQRLATDGRNVPSTCERCTRSLTGFVDLLGGDI